MRSGENIQLIVEGGTHHKINTLVCHFCLSKRQNESSSCFDFYRFIDLMKQQENT